MYTSKTVYRIKTFVPILLVSIISFSSTKAQNNSSSLQKALEEFSEDESLRNASWGFYALEAGSGRELASHNSDLSLVPASTQKVVTTLTALLMLGNDYRFETLLQYDGMIEQGVLYGNLYIKGKGDPTLGATMMHDTLSMENVFTTWLHDLKSSGIKQVKGSIIADGSWFDDHIIPPKWTWEDMGNYYGAGAHAITIHENMYRVFFQPGGRVGDLAVVIRTIPKVADMIFLNEVTTGPRGSGDNVYIYGAPYSNQRWLTGTVPLGESNFEVKGSMPDPGHFMAAAFKNHLLANNISTNGEIYTHRNAPSFNSNNARVTLSRRLSPTLDIIAERTNLKSVNTYAENLLKTVGKEKGDEGSFTAGSKVIMEFWEKIGIDTRGMRLVDGSGLSPINNITPRQLTRMLEYISRDEALYNSFIKGLPLANRNGSLEPMFASTPSAGVLRAKSGFLGNVRAYTGYTQSRDGNLIAFTIIVNNYSGSPLLMRRKMETLMDALTKTKTQ